MELKAPLQGFFTGYASRLSQVLASADWSGVSHLARDMHEAWTSGHQVFFCGNGGSAGNAVHLANDYIYGVAKRVATRYRDGRVLLAGDSAHVTNTRGGMNMNCGMHDAYRWICVAFWSAIAYNTLKLLALV